jgi:hypothetical protein
VSGKKKVRQSPLDQLLEEIANGQGDIVIATVDDAFLARLFEIESER